MSRRGVLTFKEVSGWLHRIAALLERPPWIDAVDGGLRVETVVTLAVLTTAEGVSAMCPTAPDPPLEEGQVDPLQGLLCVYKAKTTDWERSNYGLGVGARIS